MTRYISFITLLVVIGLLVILFYKVMASFFVPLFLAALLVVIFRPLHVWMLKRFKGRQKLAAFFTTAGILLTVLVPLALLFVFAAFESQVVLQSLNKTTFLQGIEDTREKLNLKMPELAEELKVVRVRLDNMSEIEQLEDVAYLGGQLTNTSLYNDDVARKIGEDELVQQSFADYLEAFDELRNVQSAIASPLEWDSEDQSDDEPTEEDLNEPQTDLDEPQTDLDKPKPLFHDFQHQLSTTIEKYDAFKVQALGGSRFWVWLREFANPTPELIDEYGSNIISATRSLLVGLGASTTSFLGRLLLGGAVMIISLYFFLLDGPAMLDSLKHLSPINDNHEEELIHEFGRVSRAVVVATLLAALAQALLGGIGYYFAGLESVFLLTLLTGCLALVPFVGAASVWIPCSLWLIFVDNNMFAGIGLAVYGGLIISMSDNLIKPMVLHGQSNLHPLLALLSVLGGIAVLGPIGILIGPMIVAFLQTLLKILQRELVSMDRSIKSTT